jgi:hypothetical protein
MLISRTRSIGVAAIGLAMASTMPLTFAFAHEGHQMKCNETSINAMKADIQSMPDGEAKTTAVRELQSAQEMIRKNDTKGCMAHMHTAMEAMEK